MRKVQLRPRPPPASRKMRHGWLPARPDRRRGNWRRPPTRVPPRRCSPTGFDFGSDRGERDGWFGESTVHFIINIKSFVGCGACGYVGEGEHFPAFRAGSGSGGSAAGRRSRSSTYPQAFLVNLARRTVAEALVWALVIVEAEPCANAGFGLCDRCIGVEVDFFVFEAAPQPLDEDVVHVAALPVHADHDAVPLQGAGEFVAGELAALIGVEDLGSAIPSERLLERLDTELGAER